MGFGQHQTFYLRQQWLTKGLAEVNRESRFFYDPKHFEILGVGKNMAKSIRHWLSATQLVIEQRGVQTESFLTPFGELVFEHDPYIKKRFTLSLLHYFLVTERNEASTWYWFFNCFNERVFTKPLLYSQIEKWTKENFEKSVSGTSIKRDIDCLIQLYTPKGYENQTPEDVIKSPFEVLNLLKISTTTNYVKNPLSHQLTAQVLYITLVKYMSKYEVTEVSLNDLINAPELWGKVFNLTRDAIIDYLNEIQDVKPIIFTRTNRLDVVRLKEAVNWIEEVENVYENEVLV